MSSNDLIDFYKERFDRTDARLDRITDVLETMTLRLSLLEQKVAFIGTGIARIDARLDGFERRLQRLPGQTGPI